MRSIVTITLSRSLKSNSYRENDVYSVKLVEVVGDS